MKINKNVLLIPIFLILVYFVIFFIVIIIEKGDLTGNSKTSEVVGRVDNLQIKDKNSYGYELNTQYSNPFSPKFGNKNSKVSVIFFLDFDCPYCYEEYFSIKNMLEKHLGDGYFEFRQFPLETIHSNSRALSNAVMCANEQDKFLDMFDSIYLDYKNRENGETSVDDLIVIYAKEVGLNLNTFNTCMKDLRYNKIINKDILDAINLGITGTPTFFVNGQKVEGVIKTENWEKLFIKK